VEAGEEFRRSAGTVPGALREGAGALASRMDLLTNKDGSIDTYMGPTQPEGEKSKIGSPQKLDGLGSFTLDSIHLKRHFWTAPGCFQM